MAVRHIETVIEIDAPGERVWSVLTDFAAMPDWNPFLREISGPLVEGGRLSLLVVPPGRRGMRFRPTILALRPGRELRWRGRLLLPGLFDGEHYFRLDPLAEDRTRLVHGEIFSGILVGPLAGTLAASEAGIAAMNDALKARAEGRAPA
jgi:hypothetical protein